MNTKPSFLVTRYNYLFLVSISNFAFPVHFNIASIKSNSTLVNINGFRVYKNNYFIYKPYLPFKFRKNFSTRHE